ncbi:MAG: arginine N-succinyltransferase [Verrucomicrobiota bacterium]|nr:arginine N-succinyltransferase [Verrucomicrobiota bacterium]
MYHIRPSHLSDLDGILELIRASGDQLTTLPNDPQFIEQRLHESQRAFYPRISAPGGEYYLFVLTDGSGGPILGTSAIVARVGGFDPFYTYEIRGESFAYKPVGVNQTVNTLHLKRSHKGPSEICSLFLRPDCRSGGLGRLLSLSRFLFLATFRERFDKEVIAEIRGWLDNDGHSPFWEAIGRHFFQQDFFSADVISGLGNKDFIEALMPKHPIYAPTLSTEAQSVIGHPHRNAEPAYRLLMKEGFGATNEVDIFDAGPMLRATVDSIITVRDLRVLTLRGVVERSVGSDEPQQTTRPGLMANRHLDFRVCLADPIAVHDELADLSAPVAEALGLEIGDEFSYISASV